MQRIRMDTLGTLAQHKEVSNDIGDPMVIPIQQS